MAKPDDIIQPKNRLKHWIILSIIFLFGCSLRFIPWSNFITREGIYFLEGDNYEHLRKIIIILNNFPFSPSHDYYVGFPVGSGNIMSPLFDLTMATLVKVVLWLPVIRTDVEFVSAVLPPIIGMSVVIPLFYWCRQTFDSKTALLGIFILSILPTHIFATLIARPDNELIEPVFAAWTFYVYSLCCCEAERVDTTKKRLISVALLSGIISTLALLYWRGALLWWIILAGHILWMMLRNGLSRSQNWVSFWLAGVTIFTTISVLIAAVCLIGLWGTQSEINFNIVSWFHVISALLAAVTFSTVAFGFFLLQKKGLSFSIAILSTFTLTALLLLCFYAIVPQYFDGILQGVAVIGGGNEWTRTIAEYQPLFGNKLDLFSLTASLKFSTIFLLITPIALLYISIFREKTKQNSSSISFFIFAAWSLFLLTLLNRRYENVFSLVMSISGALFLIFVYNSISERIKVAGRSFISIGIVVILFVLLLIPSFSFYRGLRSIGPFALKGDLEESLIWIRDHTPPTSYYDDPSQKPEYGIMARWEFGGWIEYIARRPSIATLFGIETHGLEDAAQFFLSTDAIESKKILEKNDARYVIISKTIGALPGYAKLLGVDPTGYVSQGKDRRGKTIWNTGPRYLDLVYVRLYLTDGQPFNAPLAIKAVPGMRLVYESAGQADFRGFFQEVKKVKVFERVKGATVRGVGEPGEKVSLKGTVKTNQGRRFSLIQDTVADMNGLFSLKIFYPTPEASSNSVSVEEDYRVQLGNVTHHLKATVEDIVKGNILLLQNNQKN